MSTTSTAYGPGWTPVVSVGGSTSVAFPFGASVTVKALEVFCRMNVVSAAAFFMPNLKVAPVRLIGVTASARWKVSAKVPVSPHGNGFSAGRDGIDGEATAVSGHVPDLAPGQKRDRAQVLWQRGRARILLERE